MIHWYTVHIVHIYGGRQARWPGRMYICSLSNQIDILATMPWYVEKVMVYSAPAGGAMTLYVSRNCLLMIYIYIHVWYICPRIWYLFHIISCICIIFLYNIFVLHVYNYIFVYVCIQFSMPVAGDHSHLEKMAGSLRTLRMVRLARMVRLLRVLRLAKVARHSEAHAAGCRL